jgi:eukaryotic-like serine/threonine-protein kinase
VFKFITHRPLWVNLLVGILLAIGIFSVFVLSLRWLTHHNSSKNVPQVTGKTYEQAEKILEEAGFEIEIQDSIYTDTTKPNIVVKQFPEADEIVKVNRTVYITINRAVPPMVEMPNLEGFSFRSAEMALKNNNLKFGDTTFAPDFAVGTVLKQLHKGQRIAPGTKIRMGSVIDFVLSDGVGEKEFAVPNIVGMTYSQAERMLKDVGISFFSVLADPGVTDTAGAYIYRQRPERFNDEKKVQHIRSGQTMDVWLSEDKPQKDSLGADGTVPSRDDNNP